MGKELQVENGASLFERFSEIKYHYRRVFNRVALLSCRFFYIRDGAVVGVVDMVLVV